MDKTPLWLQLINEEKEKQTGRLDLGRTGLTNLPDELKGMDWLEELILGNDDTIYPNYESKTETKNIGQVNDLRSAGFPEWIAGFKKLKVLALHSLDLAKIPAIPNADNIEVLDLDGNGISSISVNIKFFPSLRKLYLGNNNLTKIENLERLYRLEVLHVNLNQLTEIDGLQRLTGLKELVVVANWITKLKNIPASLEMLDLGENRIKSLLDFDFSQLKSLKDLRCSVNEISEISNLEYFEKLEALDLGFNKITELKNLDALTGLEHLNLVSNQIIEISNIGKLTNLNFLNLSGNKITQIKNLDQLSRLKVLILANNKISKIENVESLHQLSTFRLPGNQISQIKNLSSLKELQNLDLSRNLIEVLPNLFLFSKLTYFNLSDNKISDLTPLKKFVDKGMVFSLLEPKHIGDPGIFVRENPLSIPSAEVIAQGKYAVLRYFATLDQTKKEQLNEFKSREVKLILLGNSNVGKTHLAKYLMSDRKELPQKSVSTHGMNFKKFQYNYLTRPGEYVTVRMFDFGGQEYYHDTHHLFFTEDTVYFLLWEKTSNGFGETECERYHSTAPEALPVKEKNYNFPVVYWLDAMNSIMINKRKSFFGNAALLETDTLNNTVKPIDVVKIKNLVLVETKRSKDGNGLINTNDFIRFEPLIHSSASLDLIQSGAGITAKGINNLLENFEELIDKLVEKTWSAYFGFVNHFCSQLRENPDKQEVKDKIAMAGITDQLLVNIEDCRTLFNIVLQDENTSYTFDTIEQVEDMCRFLANRGYIIYQNNQQICLYPQELTEKMYDVLTKPQTGIVNLETVQQKSGKDCVALLQLMQDYHLLIPHTSLANTFIAPQNLPDTADDTVKLFLNSFQKPAIRYRLKGYIHKNTIVEIFFAFKDELIKDVSNNYFWKNGLVIKNGAVNDLFKIEFIQDEAARFITISSLNKHSDYSSFVAVEDKVEAVIEPGSKIVPTPAVVADPLISLPEPTNYEKEISCDGTDFVSYREAERNALKNNAVFIQNDRQYRLADYKSFLRGPVKEYFMKKIFISYSSKDSLFMRRFVTHLEPLKREGLINVWHDRMIEPGARWDDSIKEEMESADIIIFLLSPDFIATSYVFDIEIPKALERFTNKLSKLFLVQLNACGWDKTDLKSYQMTQDSRSPAKDIITIKEAGNDEAWNKIVYELEQKIRSTK